VGNYLDAAVVGHLRVVGAAKRPPSSASQVKCPLRVVDGSQPGLTDRWTPCRARVEAGRLTFTPRGRPNPLLIEVGRVDAHAWRELRWRDAASTLSVPQVRRIGVLRTQNSTLEWAVPEKQRAWAAATIRPVEPQSQGADGQ
jgi:hypothetical protein